MLYVLSTWKRHDTRYRNVGKIDIEEKVHTEYPSFVREWLMIEAYASFQTSRNSGSPSVRQFTAFEMEMQLTTENIPGHSGLNLLTAHIFHNAPLQGIFIKAIHTSTNPSRLHSTPPLSSRLSVKW